VIGGSGKTGGSGKLMTSLYSPLCGRTDRSSRSPGLGSMLLGRFNVFKLGIECDKDQTPLRLSCKQLYSRGMCVFITDEVYDRFPEQAVQVLEHITKYNNARPEAQRWKIFGRPDLWKFLVHLVEVHEKDEDEDIKAARLLLVTDLVYDLKDGPNRLPEATLFCTDWLHVDDKTYDKQYEQDHVKAAGDIIEAFALESQIRHEYCRRWVVIHSPDADLTKPPYEVTEGQSLLRFMTTEKYLATFRNN